jgi:methylenetetrahydrofolate reductase (NADPH)
MDIKPAPEVPSQNRFKDALTDSSTFCITWEQVPGRGASEKERETILQNSAGAARGGRVHAISITDSPGGSPTFSSATLGIEIRKLGIESLVHLAMRDRNRSEVESELYGLAAENVRNLLIISGDYPARDGFEGRAHPVFDLDPTHVMQLGRTMNSGLQYQSMGKPITLAPTDFFAGVAVSPFKQLESELLCQYYKLDKKIKGGAGFIISQIGYDARKMQELIFWLKGKGYAVPALANIYALTYPAARLMSENKIPGCVVTDKLLAELEEERKAPDKGKSARLLRAAKMYAVARGLGYKGAHIGGYNMTYDAVEYIMDKGEELYPRWEEFLAGFDYPQENGFYLFEKNMKSGTNTAVPSARPLKGKKTLLSDFSRFIDGIFFVPKNPLFKFSQKVFHRIDRIDWMNRTFVFMEHAGKGVFFDCLHCGDCSLVDTSYLCTTSQCPKGERLGPCGGSFHGWCEVYPGKRKCVWVRSYSRLKSYHEEDSLGSYIIPPRDWQLWQTSSWINFYLGRDHTAKRMGVSPPAEKTHGVPGEKSAS